MLRFVFSFFALIFLLSFNSNENIKTIYQSLDPHSIAQHLAFYELYPDSSEGQKALKHAGELLGASREELFLNPLLSNTNLDLIISLVNHPPTIQKIEAGTLQIIDKLSAKFANRKLQGSHIWEEAELKKLPSEEIDLGRALLIVELGDNPEKKDTIRYYEALLDLMSLQILSHLSQNATDYEKIKAINDFIFFEMHFRFPPKALWSKEIDSFTFLPSVLDKRRGVCLGVSVLYFCLSQRLDLKLEAITPPGHIFLRYNEKNSEINIETTARGINLPKEVYLSIDTRKLQTRTVKEMIGLSLINQASVFLQKEEFEKSLKLYEQALTYLSNDQLLKELLAFNYLFVGQKEKGKQLLKEVKDVLPDFAVSKETVAEDLLNRRVDIEGIKPLFKEIDETRESILAKNNTLIKTLKTFPKFRAGLLQLASGWLQIGREKEAQNVLLKYYAIDDSSPIVNYYLAAISLERYDFNNAWKYLKKCEQITKSRDHNPKVLKELEEKLKETSAPYQG